MNKKNTIIAAIAVVVISIGVAIISQQSKPSRDSVKIGAILPLTGPIGYLGEGESLGIRLAAGAQDPAANKKVEFVFEDSQGKADAAISASRKLLEIQDIPIQAVFTTTPVLATLPIFKDSGRDVLVMTQCMVPGVTKGYPFAYRLYATSDEETDLLAAYAKQRGLRRFAGIHINNRFGEEGVNFFRDKIRAFGGEMVLQEQFTFADKDFRSLLTKIKSMNVDGLIIYAYSTTFPVIFQQMQELGMDLPVLGNLDLALGGLEDKVNLDFLKKVVFPAPRYYFEKDNPKTKSFNEKVRAAGSQPSIDVAYAYDMATLLIAAVQKADSGEPKAVAAALETLMPFEGATGSITLDENHDTRAEMKLVRWGSDGIEIVPPLDQQ